MRQSVEVSQNFTQFYMKVDSLTPTCPSYPAAPYRLGHLRSTRHFFVLGNGFRKMHRVLLPGLTADTFHASVAVAFEAFQSFFYGKEDLGSCMLSARAAYHVRCLCRRSTRKLDFLDCLPENATHSVRFLV